MNYLEELSCWFKKIQLCNNDYIIRVGNLDNPGWWLKVPLSGTKLADRTLPEIRLERCEEDWLNIFIEENVFIGFADPFKLDVLLACFNFWIDGELTTTIVEEISTDSHVNLDNITFLESWYKSNCYDDWEHFCGVEITFSKDKIKVSIDLADTLEDEKNVVEVEYFTNEDDWLKIYRDIDKEKFVGEGDLSKLDRILGEFKNFVEN